MHMIFNNPCIDVATAKCTNILIVLIGTALISGCVWSQDGCCIGERWPGASPLQLLRPLQYVYIHFGITLLCYYIFDQLRQHLNQPFNQLSPRRQKHEQYIIPLQLPQLCVSCHVGYARLMGVIHMLLSGSLLV